MNKKFIVLLIIFIIFLFISFYNYEPFSNNKTFSNTENWGERELQMLNKITPKGIKLANEIPIKNFPTNLSIEAKVEIDNIKNKMNKLTDKIIQDINTELWLENMIDRFNVNNDEAVKIKNIFINEIDPIIMYLKKKYNRVRPYKLDNSIIPVIDPPKHPSYPSGHSTQSYFIANILSEKYPSKRDLYFKIAEKIAVNREYAGVHYESDTKFGEFIASKLFQYYSKEKNPILN